MYKYDSGLLCGRFQTFHIGHESLIETGLRLCDRLVILVGSAQESNTERNPYNVSTRIEMLKTVYGSSNKKIIIEPLVDLTNENDITPQWGKYVLNAVDNILYKVPELMIYGNDESRSRWFDLNDIKDCTEIIVPRTRLPITATNLRELMMMDRRKEWMKYVNPKLHKLYPLLREKLMNIKWYQNKQKELLMKHYKEINENN